MSSLTCLSGPGTPETLNKGDICAVSHAMSAYLLASRTRPSHFSAITLNSKQLLLMTQNWNGLQIQRDLDTMENRVNNMKFNKDN